MKNWITAFSSIVLGVLAAAPIFELQKILEARKRLMVSLFLVATAFVFFMAGLLIGLIDATLQYSAQGFVFWDGLLALAVGLVVAGIAFALAFKRSLPKPARPDVMAGILRKILDISSELAAESKVRTDFETGSARPPPRRSETPQYAH